MEPAIVQYAQSCVSTTVATAEYPEDVSEPSQDEVNSLRFLLGRKPTPAETSEFIEAWDAALKVKRSAMLW